MKSGVTLIIMASFLFLTSCSSLNLGKTDNNLCRSGKCRLDKSCCKDACGKCKGNNNCKISKCSKCATGKSCKIKKEL